MKENLREFVTNKPTLKYWLKDEEYSFDWREMMPEEKIKSSGMKKDI